MRKENVLMGMLTEYEEKQITAIDEWKKQEPGVVSKVTGVVSAPLAFITRKVIPEAAMKAVLNGANSAGEFLADEGDICRDGNVNSITELLHKDLRTSDRLADEVHDWAIAMAGAEGGAAGAAGVVGIALDIPAVLTLALRTIHKIGLCYGYRANNKEDRDYVLGILSAAGANSQAEKNEALIALRTVYVIVQKQTWKKIGEKAAEKRFGSEAAIIAVKNLCKQLGINFSKRKAMQVIPVVGGAIGAAVNADFIRDVGYAARRSYQERWLRDNGKWM